MRNLLVHLIVTALLLALVDYFIDGIAIEGFGHALLAAIVLGLVNALIRPVLVILTLPITIITLGVFLLVINALMMMLAAAVAPGFTVYELRCGARRRRTARAVQSRRERRAAQRQEVARVRCA